jgi:hypothetical protein
VSIDSLTKFRYPVWTNYLWSILHCWCLLFLVSLSSDLKSKTLFVGVCSQAQRPSRLPYSRRGLQGENHWPGAVMPGATFDSRDKVTVVKAHMAMVASSPEHSVHNPLLACGRSNPQCGTTFRKADGFVKATCAWAYSNFDPILVSSPQDSSSVSSGLFSWQQSGTVHSSEWIGCSFTLDPELLPQMFFFVCVCGCCSVFQDLGGFWIFHRESAVYSDAHVQKRRPV